MKVIYRGDADDAQVRYGGNDDPRGVLTPGAAYEVVSIEAHGFHTQYTLCGFSGRKFNSVHFDSPSDKAMTGEKISAGSVVATIIDCCHSRHTIETMRDLALRDGRYGADERRAIEAAAKVKLETVR